MQIFRTLYTLTMLAYFLPAIVLPGFWTAGVWGRWIMLAVTGVSIALIHAPSVQLPQLASMGLGLFLLYSLCTGFWSENAYLSLAKWLAYCLVVLVFFVGGFLIGGKGVRNPFSPFAPIAYLTIGSSLLAIVLRGGGFTPEKLFIGYSYNPNMMGSMAACCTPWALTELYVTRADPRRRTWAMAMGVALFVILLLTRSRAALLMAAIMVLSVLLAVKPSGKLRALIAVVLVIVFAYVFVPGLYTVGNDVVHKGHADVFASRRGVWEISLDKARQSGVFGVGFGISGGLSSGWFGEATSMGYFREKGSSALAIWEEMGIAGLIVTAFLIVMLVLELLQAARPGASVADRFYAYLAVGALVGSLGSAAFEAWFTAPGSPEIAAFWAMLGLVLGTLRDQRVSRYVVYQPA